MPNKEEAGPCKTSILGIKRIAVIASEIVHAVEINIAARGEAADSQVVPCELLAGGQADARNIAQNISQRGVGLISHADFLRNHCDRLRRVEDRLGCIWVWRRLQIYTTLALP